MVYVPTTVHVPAPPSPEARDLADKIVELVHVYEQKGPELGAHDVDVALRLARAELVPAANRTAVTVIVVIMLSVLLGFGIVFSGMSGSPAMLMIIVGAAVALGLAVVVAKASRR